MFEVRSEEPRFRDSVEPEASLSLEQESKKQPLDLHSKEVWSKMRGEILNLVRMQLGSVDRKYGKGYGDQLAQDLAQEACIKIFENANKFRGDAEIKTWIFKIVRNIIIDHFRKAEQKTTDLTAEGEVELGTTSASGSADVGLLVDIERALENLPTEERDALLLTAQDWNAEEIAEKQQTPVGTAYRRISHGRTKMKNDREEKN